jgi:hypothetical protein
MNRAAIENTIRKDYATAGLVFCSIVARRRRIAVLLTLMGNVHLSAPVKANG